jgi:hypothetical protein
MTDSYTEEELAALPQTPTVFEKPPLEFDTHEWLQEGYIMRDVCSQPTSACEPVGIPVPTGKTLVKKDGRYSFISEL